MSSPSGKPPKRRFGPTAIYEAIVGIREKEPGIDYLSIERIMAEVGCTVRTAWTFWKAERGDVQAMLHRAGIDAVLVTQETHAEDAARLKSVEAARLNVAGGGGIGGGVGLYFPNGNVNDVYHLAGNRHRAFSGGAVAGNMLHLTAERLAVGGGDGPGARDTLNEFTSRVLKEGDPKANAVIKKQIPQIPKGIGGQYPLGIEETT